MNRRIGNEQGAADESELDLLRRRDPEAMDRLVRENYLRVYAAIARRVADSESANDLAQETFFQGFKSIHTYRGLSSLSSWLIGIAMNVTRQHLRMKGRHRPLPDEFDRVSSQVEWDRSGNRQVVADTWNPELMMEKRRRIQFVREAIRRLPECYREVLTLRDLDELSTTEVATVLSLSEVNVRVRLSRARKALREILVGMLHPSDIVELHAVL